MSLFDSYAEHIINKDFIVKNVEEQLVLLLKEYLNNIPIYVEFPQMVAKTPAIVLTVHNVIGKQDFSIGNYVGQTDDGDDIYGIYWHLTVTIDIWSLDTQTRDEIISIIQTLLMMKRFTLKNRIGLVDLYVAGAQERGFDKTDRIIQYASHQLEDIQRQLLQIELVVQSTYTPIVEYGFIKSVIFTMGQWTKTLSIPSEDVFTEQTINVPFGVSAGETYDSIAATLTPFINKRPFMRPFNRLRIP